MKLIEFFQDDNGGFSMSRLLTFLMVSAYLIMASRISSATNVIPDVPLQLGGLIVAIYGINKFGTKKEDSVENQ